LNVPVAEIAFGGKATGRRFNDETTQRATSAPRLGGGACLS